MTYLSDRMIERYGWIEASLRYGDMFGPVEKKCYGALFHLAPPQVSKDQAAFLIEINESASLPLVENQAGKLTMISDRQMPPDSIFRVPTIDQWLKIMMEGHYEQVLTIERSTPRPDVLRLVIQAIRKRHAISIDYRSRSDEQLQTRRVSPHTLIHIVGRHHVRAYDHGKGRFSDFVMSRIVACAAVSEKDQPYVGQETDHEWQSTTKIKVSSIQNPVLPGVALDYGLDTTGVRIHRVRKALAHYLVDEPEKGFKSPVTVTQYLKTDTIIPEAKK